VEARGQVVAVEEDALGRNDGAQLGASSAADASVGPDGLAEGPELLGVVAVGTEGGVRGAAGEGCGERVGRRGRVGLGRVVDGGCGMFGSVSLAARIGAHVPSEMSDIPGIVRLPMNRMEGVRSACTAAWRRTLEVNMVAVEMRWGFE
jgi:hypothetical protein